MNSPENKHRFRRQHFFRIRNTGFRELLTSKGWHFKGGFCEKYIAGERVMLRIVEKKPDYFLCSVQRIKDLSAEMKQKRAAEKVPSEEKDAINGSINEEDTRDNIVNISEDDVIAEKGVPVYFQQWDSGNPGAGAGSDVVYKFAGKYWWFDDWDGYSGPFDNIIDAFPEPYIPITEASESITCAELSINEIIAHIKPIDLEKEVVIAINGIEHRVCPDGTVMQGHLE